MVSAGLARRMRKILVQKTSDTIGSNQFKFISEVITLPRVICTDWLRCRFSNLSLWQGGCNQPRDRRWLNPVPHSIPKTTET